MMEVSTRDKHHDCPAKRHPIAWRISQSLSGSATDLTWSPANPRNWGRALLIGSERDLRSLGRGSFPAAGGELVKVTSRLPCLEKDFAS